MFVPSTVVVGQVLGQRRVGGSVHGCAEDGHEGQVEALLRRRMPAPERRVGVGGGRGKGQRLGRGQSQGSEAASEADKDQKTMGRREMGQKNHSALGNGRGRGRPPAAKGGKYEYVYVEPGIYGRAPDPTWRSIPHDHLRSHPLYEALPPPEEVVVKGIEDVWQFRQDSWQWDALHEGRITTSRAATCLGFYEELSAQALGVPPSLRSHEKVISAWHKLRQPPVSLTDLGTAKLVNQRVGSGQPPRRRRGKLWRHRPEGKHKGLLVPYSYHPPPPSPRRFGSQHSGHVRMAWGSKQEATSVLTALNYYALQHGATVREVGLCPAEAHYSDAPELQLPHNSSPFLLGASPDGVICYPDGSMEALEVKNHAPFRFDRTARSLKVADPGPYAEIAAWHVPQLALEMYCLGPDCRGVVFVSQSATRGAVILRLDRDDDYIRDVLTELRRFHTSFVEPGILPPENFWTGLPTHQRILEATLAQARSAKVVVNLRNALIQRSPWGSLKTLFHDEVIPSTHPFDTDDTHGDVGSRAAGRPHTGASVGEPNAHQPLVTAPSTGRGLAKSGVVYNQFVPSSVVPRTASAG